MHLFHSKILNVEFTQDELDLRVGRLVITNVIRIFIRVLIQGTQNYLLKIANEIIVN